MSQQTRTRRHIPIVIAAALSASVALVGFDVRAAERAPANPPPAERSPFGEKFYPAAAQTSRRPLMSLLDRVGLARPLDNAGIRVFGHVEGSYTHNFADPVANLNLGRVFDIEEGQPLLNQLDLNVERVVTPSPDEWNFGGRIGVMYGSDTRFIHSNGLFDHHEDDPTSGFLGGPEKQFDLTQE